MSKIEPTQDEIVETEDTPKPFKVVVLGDTGFDLYSQIKSGYTSEDGHVELAQQANDFDVPSGAHFLGLMLKELLDGFDPGQTAGGAGQTPQMRVKVLQLVPTKLRSTADTGWRHGSTTLKFLLHLKEVKNKWRIKSIQPLQRQTSRHSPLQCGVFRELAVNDMALSCEESQQEVANLIKRPPELLIVHDGGGSWRRQLKGDGDAMRILAATLKPDASKGMPRVIVNVGHELPPTEFSEKDSRYDFKESPVWQLLAKHAENVCVVCSANLLRRGGALISRRLSWELTVEDLAADMHLFEPLRVLARFKHLVIRFGVVGALHAIRVERHRYADLTFAPTAKYGNHRDPVEEGLVVGNNGLLIAAMARTIAESQAKVREKERFEVDWVRDNFKRALENGLQACMKSFDEGYVFPVPPDDNKPKGRESENDDQRDTVERTKLGEEVARNFAKSVKKVVLNPEPTDHEGSPTDGAAQANRRAAAPAQDQSGARGAGKSAAKRSFSERLPVLGSVAVPCALLEHPPELLGMRSDWEILRDSLNKEAGSNLADKQSNPQGKVCPLGSPTRFNLGLAIVLFGVHAVLNRDLPGPEDAIDCMQRRRLFRVLNYPDCVTSAEEVTDFVTLPIGRLPKWPVEPSACARSITRQVAKAPVYVPIQTFGKLSVIERKEIESLSSIRNLMKNYLDSRGDDVDVGKPISVAVFGPPGSGKSFAVKELASSINDSLQNKVNRIETIEYNVAQFRTIDDLGEAITKASSLNNEGKVPLVFFDEFDCSLNTEPLGWLKYFLAPMQDGSFFGGRQNIKIGRAIFVFAGGVYPTFDEFDPSSDPVGSQREQRPFEELRQRREAFRAAKGPDFISRLRGHINVLPINAADGETKPIIRRAILLRSLLEVRKQTVQHGDYQVAQVDEDIIYAMLTIDRYRHGARSLEAVLQMCISMESKILKASLPSRTQLNMHVDADEFMIRMARGRARRSRVQDGSPSSGKPTPAPTDLARAPADPQDGETDRFPGTKLEKEARGRQEQGADDDDPDRPPPAPCDG